MGSWTPGSNPFDNPKVVLDVDEDEVGSGFERKAHHANSVVVVAVVLASIEYALVVSRVLSLLDDLSYWLGYPAHEGDRFKGEAASCGLS